LKLINTTETFPPSTFIATIGFFDGVHLGHRYLLQLLKDEAKKAGKKSLVISFDKHPKTILPTDYIPSLLTGNVEKIQLLEDFGIDACVLLPFDIQMASLSAYEFLKQIIVDKLGVDTLFIGYNHRFGRNREEGILEYIKYGKELGVKVIEETSFEFDNTQISSSIIRRLIECGDVEKAKLFLSYPYTLEGLVVIGNKIGQTIGYPTANLEVCEENKLIPPYGVYAVQVVSKNKAFWGVLNIGNRPTLNLDNKATIEVHIINFSENIYGEKITVKFFRKIREEIKFNSLEDLTTQIGKDKQLVLDLINNESLV
jgi:riboflavin kinase/FMN adenylyltransferase